MTVHIPCDLIASYNRSH